MCNLCPIQSIFNTSQGNKPLLYGFRINDTIKSIGTCKNTLFFNFYYYSYGVKLVHGYFKNNTIIFFHEIPNKQNLPFSLFIEDIKITTYIPKNNHLKNNEVWNKWKITNFLRNKEQIHIKITGNCNQQ